MSPSAGQQAKTPTTCSRLASNFPEPEYINALAQAIQEVKPEACYREAMREANIVDEYTVGVLGSQE